MNPAFKMDEMILTYECIVKSNKTVLETKTGFNNDFFI